MIKKHCCTIKMPTKKALKEEIGEQKEKVRKLLAKWIAQEIFMK